MRPTSALRLDYAPLPKWPRRRWVRVIILLAVVFALLCGMGVLWSYRGWIASRAHAVRVQYRSLHFARSSDQLCCRRAFVAEKWQLESHPAGQAASLLWQEMQAMISANPPVLPVHRAFPWPPPAARTSSTAYLHERQNKHGSRLVCVNVILSPDNNFIGLDTTVIETSYWKAAPRPLWTGHASFVAPQLAIYPIDVFAGQNDGNDASRFTIQCRADAFGSVTLQGRLRDDDTVEFKTPAGLLMPWN